MSKPKVLVITYSLYGHITTLAKEIVAGLEEAGVEGVLMRVPETLSDEVRTKMHAPPIDESIPVATMADLPTADGFLFGLPTRFGRTSAQINAFLDQTGGHWQSGALVGKPAGAFTSTATQSGGNQTTVLGFVPNLVHHGMVFVPLGYTTTKLFEMNEVHGASPYGAGTLAGPDGSRTPSALELEIARHQGKYFGGVVASFKAGKAKVAAAAPPSVVEKLDEAKKLDEKPAVPAEAAVVAENIQEAKVVEEAKTAAGEAKEGEKKSSGGSCTCTVA